MNGYVVWGEPLVKFANGDAPIFTEQAYSKLSRSSLSQSPLNDFIAWVAVPYQSFGPDVNGSYLRVPNVALNNRAMMQ